MLSNSIPVIFGCSNIVLTTEEKDFFRQYKPYGFILFKRNIETPKQVQELVLALRETVGWECPILIDQEGGRVARLRPPHWLEFPSMEKLVAGLELEEAKTRVFNNALAIGKMLKELGINVNCAPVCDLRIQGAHDVIGDRSFGEDPKTVAIFSASMCEGYRASGIIPIIKHIPGHGRAKVDSHESLPTVTTALEILEQTDFKVFSLLSDQECWAMTAHIVYTALDKNLPATVSKTVIGYIRNKIAFKGLLISDDISMKALKGELAVITQNVLSAGCDIVLHCNGQMEEMRQVVRGC